MKAISTVLLRGVRTSLLVGVLTLGTAVNAGAEMLKTVGNGTVACDNYTTMNFFWEMTKAGRQPTKGLNGCFHIGSPAFGPATGVVVARVGELVEATWDYQGSITNYWVIAEEVEVIGPKPKHSTADVSGHALSLDQAFQKRQSCVQGNMADCRELCARHLNGNRPGYSCP